MGSGNEGRAAVDLEIEAVHLRGRVAELERIVKAQEDELGKLRGHDGLSERERRILNMWPRFEDGGECAWLGDGYIDTGGAENAVCGVMLDGECASLIGRDGFHTGFEEGERVERPAPEVLDADGEPDSWEKLGEDAAKSMSDYWKCDNLPCHRCPSKIDGKMPYEHYNTDASCADAKGLDVVRRAKALAGVAE